MVYEITGKTLNAGALPASLGIILSNVNTIAFVGKYFRTGMPLVSKRITVDGTAVTEPKNVIVPIGTSVKDLLEFVGLSTEEDYEVIMGGPMTGVLVKSENAVIEKRNNVITVMKPQSKVPPSIACIRCDRCVDACPMQLYPAKVYAAVSSQNSKNTASLNAEYCIECGSCSYVCPAKRPLTENMRLAKEKFKEEEC
jgi:electron transport complex protein RnfC